MTNPDTSYNNEISKHGVFLEVLQLGVMLTGRSGVGKSEVALGLINRDHRLIADDSVLITKDSDNSLTACCHEILQDLLEVRGLGILNIRAMFGEQAIRKEYPLQLIVHLVPASDSEIQQMDRAAGFYNIQNILGVEVPEISIPVASGRNLSILVEAAVRNQILRMNGFDASEDFRKRHLEFIARETKL